MTFLPIAEEGELSPFSEWYTLRDQLVPLIGERAFLLFAFAICDEFGGVPNAEYFRTRLVESGNDVENPQVTETEQLFLDLGALVVRNPRDITTASHPQFERAFSPHLRLLLVKFAALMVATNIVTAVGRIAT
jgi:hypothetical protein